MKRVTGDPHAPGHYPRTHPQGVGWVTRCTCGWASIPDTDIATVESRARFHIAVIEGGVINMAHVQAHREHLYRLSLNETLARTQADIAWCQCGTQIMHQQPCATCAILNAKRKAAA